MLPSTLSELKCHENVIFQKGGNMLCQQCGKVMDIYKYTSETEFKNVNTSMNLAYEYADLTGDVDIPCKVHFRNMPGILPNMVLTTVKRLWIGQRLLQEATSPFVIPPRAHTYNKERLIEKFLEEYLTMVDNMKDESQTFKTIKTILGNMKELIGGGPDMFERYFKLIVPYVKECTGNPIFPVVQVGYTKAETFKLESELATSIRAECSKYCIHFDVIYVMIYCYIAALDMKAISNLVFNLAGMVCCNYFSVPKLGTIYDQIISPILHSETCYRESKYVIINIESGKGSEILSVEFFADYQKLDQTLTKRFLNGRKDTPYLRFAYSQSFPYTMFVDRDEDYFGFMMGISHIASQLKSNNKKLLKGTLFEAKTMYNFVKEFVIKMREFRRNAKESFFWTNDIFEVFLASTGLEDQFQKLLDIFVLSQSNCKNETTEQSFGS